MSYLQPNGQYELELVWLLKCGKLLGLNLLKFLLHLDRECRGRLLNIQANNAA